MHRYKFLVDSCWVIDLAGHTEADARGNINNVRMCCAALRLRTVFSPMHALPSALLLQPPPVSSSTLQTCSTLLDLPLPLLPPPRAQQIVMVSSAGKPMVQPHGSTDGDSDEGEGAAGARAAQGFVSAAGEGVEDVAAAVAAAVVATVEPPSAVDAASSAGGSALGAEAAVPSPPWTSREELEALARFGAAVLAFHTRLGVKLRHKLH